MFKQIVFSEDDQKIIKDCLTVIASVLFKKIDEGHSTPHLGGTIDAEKGKKVLAFEFAAMRSEDSKEKIQAIGTSPFDEIGKEVSNG